MNFTELLLTAFSLSLDAVAVSIAASALKHLTLKDALKISFSFGLFQSIMPLLGLWAGSIFAETLLKYGTIIGFVALFGLGLKMLKESIHKPDKEEIEEEKHLTDPYVLLTVSVATSIDALVIGLTFNFVKVNVASAVSLIGLVTFALCLFGTYIGHKGRSLAGNKIEIIGALILIAIAFKILIF
jgi:putative Mn2+ efflux pump MntP